MNNLKLYNFEDQQVRIIQINNAPWFVAKDICDVLEIGNPSQALSRLDEDEKNTIILNEGIGNPQKTIVNEPGLYALILGSRKPEAKQFKRWVTHEVIPSIRKHGAYMTPDALQQAVNNPDFMIGLLENLKYEQQKRQQAELVIEQQKTKVIFADAVAGASNSILIGDLAKLLKQNGVSIGAKRLFEWMRENGYLGKANSHKNKPTQKAMELGLFTIKETPVFHNSGSTSVSITPKVTGKGQQYFINKFLRKGEAM